MSSEKLGHHNNVLKGDLGGAFDILTGSTGEQTDLGLARKFGGAAAAFAVRDIGAMNGRVVKVRREQDDAVEDFSALQIDSGSIEQFAIGNDVLALYNKASYNPSSNADNFWRATTELDLGSGAMSFSCDFVLTGDFGSNTARLLQKYNGATHFYWESATSFRYKIDGTSGTTAISSSVTIEKNKKYNLEFIRDASDNTTLKIDGVTVGTNTTTARNTGQILIGRISGFRLVGTALNWNFNSGQHIYAGDGVETSNWVDTGTGGNNLSKEGSPVAFTGQGISAFVDTWYDQSGNGRDLIQATTGNQCHIIEDGAYVGGIKSAPASNSTTNDNVQYMRITGTNSFASNDLTTNKVGMLTVVDDLEVGTASGVSIYVVAGNIRGVQGFPTGGLGIQKSGANHAFKNNRASDAENKITTTATSNNKIVLTGGTFNNTAEFGFSYTDTVADEETGTGTADIVLTSQKDFGIFYSTYNTGSAYEHLNATRTAGGIMKEFYIMDGDIIDEISTINRELRDHYNLA